MERKNLRRIRNASLGQPSALEKGLRSYEMRPKANRVFNLSNVFIFRRFCNSYYGEDVSSVGRATGGIPVCHRFESDTASLIFSSRKGETGMRKEMKPILIGALTAGVIIAVGVGFHAWTIKTIPYSYRQNLLDAVDYLAGKNVFNRVESLQ